MAGSFRALLALDVAPETLKFVKVPSRGVAVEVFGPERFAPAIRLHSKAM